MNHKLYITLLLLFGIFSSCEILDVEPYDAIPAEEVLTTKKGLEGSLTGAYSVLQSGAISTDVIVFADLAADNFIARGSKAEYREVSINDIQASNTYVESVWNRSYEGINLVNYIIDGIDGISGITQEEKDNFLGQCYFLRAFNYFNLVRYFGEIPKRVKPVSDASPETLNIPLSTEEEIYNLIVSDLEAAEQYFAGKGEGNSAFANEGAIKALLAKVHLYRENWTQAAAYAEEVINMNYSLEQANYADIFDETKNSNEIIFQVDFYNSQDASNLMNDWLTHNGRFEVAVWKDLDRNETIADDYEVGDKRLSATVQFYSGAKGDDYYCNKYTDNITRKDNIIFLRLAEMYLIKAEALNENGYVADGPAFDALNAVRTRAGISSLTSTQVPNQQAFRLAVEKERNLELVFEGNRLFDLRRTGRINDVLEDIGTLKEAGWYFPVPQTEIDTNDAID